MRRTGQNLGTIATVLACLAMATPAHAQFGGFVRDLESAARDSRTQEKQDPATDQTCEQKASKDVGARLLGGILGRTARDQAYRAGLPSFLPVSEFSDQISAAIACQLDPQEQEQAANATLTATRLDEDTGIARVGSSSSWQSDTREDVTGTSTVSSRQETGVDGLDCITVTDVIIVQGEETRADKRMCRAPGAARYSIVA